MSSEPTPELTSEQSQQLQLHKQFPEQILRNALLTPDGTLLESKHRYDFVKHKDKLLDTEVGIDGGLAYLRRTGSLAFCTDLSVTTKDDFLVVREAFTWGSYGKDGKQPRAEIKLKDMTTDHIQAILRTQQHIKGSVVQQLFKQELLYRSFQQAKDNVL